MHFEGTAKSLYGSLNEDYLSNGAFNIPIAESSETMAKLDIKSGRANCSPVTYNTFI